MTSTACCFRTILPALLIAGAVAASADAPAVRLADLEGAAFAAARASVPAPDRFEPETFRMSGETPAADARLRLVSVDGPNQSGNVQLTFAVLTGETRREIWTSVRGRVMGPALVATRSIPRGEPIDAESFEATDVDLTRLTQEPLRDPRDLAEQVPIRTLGTGRVITADLLRALPVVRRNETVNIQVRKPGFVVNATGRVLADGAPGETVTAVNSATGARILCRVLPDGSLDVIHGLGDRARR